MRKTETMDVSLTADCCTGTWTWTSNELVRSVSALTSVASVTCATTPFRPGRRHQPVFDAAHSPGTVALVQDDARAWSMAMGWAVKLTVEPSVWIVLDLDLVEAGP